MRALFCLLSIISASAALAQPLPADTMTVTAERLNRGALRAQASKFMRTALADTRNGQNARWFTPLCPVALGVEDKVGRLFTSRIADVARHVGLKLAGGDCDPNVAVVFTRDARTLVKTVNRRQNGALDIYAGVSHSVLTDLAVERLKDSDLKELISTNSVPLRLAPGSKITALSVAGLLGEGIRRIHDDESVSSLFEVKKPK